MKAPNHTTPKWLIDPDELPRWLRWPFNAALAIVFIWFMAQMLLWFALGALNSEPFPQAQHAAFVVVMSCWVVAISIRWGYSIIARREHVQT